MSRHRKQKNREKKEFKDMESQANKQRARVPSDDIWTGVRYSPLSERGYPSVQRLEACSKSFAWKMEGNCDAFCTFIDKGWSSTSKARAYYLGLDT